MRYFVCLCLFIFLGCESKHAVGNSSGETTGVALKIAIDNVRIKKASVVIQNNGTILFSEDFNWEQTDTEYLLDDVLVASGMNLDVRMFDSTGAVLYQGNQIVDLEAGVYNRVDVAVAPQFATLRVDVPVGMENKRDISGGVLVLTRESEHFSVSLAGSIPVKKFEMDYVPFNSDYSLTISLWDSNGDTLYYYSDTIDIDQTIPQLMQFSMESLIAQLLLSITPGEVKSVMARASYPDSRLRQVSVFNDLVVSEISPNPKSSGDEYEWFELMNMGMDTLNLNGCIVSKSLGATSATTHFVISSDLFIEPAGFVVLGRDSVPFADYAYQSFVLSNSGQGLYIECDGIVVDTLHYYAASDTLNPYPLMQGHSLDIAVNEMEQRQSGTSWCKGVEEYTLANGLVNYGSPHSFGNCTPL